MADDPSPAVRRLDSTAHGRELRQQVLVGVELESQATFEPTATSRDLRGIKGGFLKFGHFHRDRRHLDQMRVAADTLSAIAEIGQEFRFVPDADLAHFDPCLEFRGEHFDQLSEVDASLGQVVDNDPFTAEEVLDHDQIHGQIHSPDDTAALIELFAFLAVNPFDLVRVGSGQGASDIALLGVSQHLDLVFSRLPEDQAELKSPLCAQDGLRLRRKSTIFRSGKYPEKSHGPVTDDIIRHPVNSNALDLEHSRASLMLRKSANGRSRLR